MFAVTAIIEIQDAPWTKSRSVPTFYLDERVQGITDHEHAEKIALDVLDPTGSLRDSPYHKFNITACRV